MSIKSFYFFTLVGMAILYGFMWGQKRQDQQSKSVIQRDSPFGHPSETDCWFFSKYPCWIHDIFLRSFSDSKCFHFIYQVDFGNRWQWLFVLSALGALNALLLGNLVGNLFPNMGLAQKEGLGVAVTMAMSFFAGMMGSQDIKYWIDLHIPVLGKLNLVNLISESFYQLYFYRSLEDFYLNLFWLVAFMVILAFSNLMFERRVQYVAV